MFRTLVISASLILVNAVGQTESKPNRQESEPRQQIHVRIYDYAQVPLEVVVEAKRVSSSIFQKIGVEVLWSDHSFSNPGETAVATDSVYPKLQLRILTRKMAERLPVKKNMTGLAFQAKGEQAARVANVFYYRVEDLAQQRICSKGEILGHAAAHELGHLLLGNLDHSSTGLMKAQLGQRELESATRGDLLFTEGEALLIRRALGQPNPDR
jgi:hypothetical protein